MKNGLALRTQNYGIHHNIEEIVGMFSHQDNLEDSQLTQDMMMQQEQQQMVKMAKKKVKQQFGTLKEIKKLKQMSQRFNATARNPEVNTKKLAKIFKGINTIQTEL